MSSILDKAKHLIGAESKKPLYLDHPDLVQRVREIPHEDPNKDGKYEEIKAEAHRRHNEKLDLEQKKAVEEQKALEAQKAYQDYNVAKAKANAHEPTLASKVMSSIGEGLSATGAKASEIAHSDEVRHGSNSTHPNTVTRSEYTTTVHEGFDGSVGKDECCSSNKCSSDAGLHQHNSNGEYDHKASTQSAPACNASSDCCSKSKEDDSQSTSKVGQFFNKLLGKDKAKSERKCSNENCKCDDCKCENCECGSCSNSDCKSSLSTCPADCKCPIDCKCVDCKCEKCNHGHVSCNYCKDPNFKCVDHKGVDCECQEQYHQAAHKSCKISEDGTVVCQYVDNDGKLHTCTSSCTCTRVDNNGKLSCQYTDTCVCCNPVLKAAVYPQPKLHFSAHQKTHNENGDIVL